MNNSKINQAFLTAYLDADKACAEKFGTKSGITEYIHKLTDNRYAPGRENCLHRLIKYRSVRNRIAHEAGAIKNIDTVTKADITWLRGFFREVKGGRDPLSRYLKSASKVARLGALKKALVLFGVGVAVILVIALFVILM